MRPLILGWGARDWLTLIGGRCPHTMAATEKPRAWWLTSEMAARIRAHDWGSTALGPMESWGHPLKTAVQLMLGAAQPTYVAWGPELVSLYNDGYIPILGAKHPSALGRPLREVWADIWDDLQPLVEATLTGQGQHCVDCPLEISGRPERPVSWFTFSWTPLRNDAGDVEGFYCATTETTDRILAERALHESEQRLRLAIEAAEIGIFEIEVETGRVRYSSELARLLGFPEVRETDVEAAFARVHREDVAHVRRLYNEALSPSGSGHLMMDFRFVRPGGEVRWMTWNGRLQSQHRDGELSAPRIVGVCIDITERKRHEEHIQLLMREVNHRSRNMLALVMAIARQTFRAEHRQALDLFQGRIQALSTSLDLLVRNEWRGVELSDLVRSQLSHFSNLFGNRIRWGGPTLMLSPTAAEAIGMVLHELATNAGKHGALKDDAGTVRLDWQIQSDETGAAIFELSWTETAGTAVTPPTRRGFGSAVIIDAIKAQLGAEVNLAYPPSGIVWQMRCPLGAIVGNSVGASPGAAPAAPLII